MSNSQDTTMPSEKWAEIRRIFHAAVDLNDDERSAVVERECSADPSLRLEVESLLTAHRDAGETLENPAVAWHPPLAMRDPWLERKIGPYQPVARIGEGGMGVVYRAVRVDDHFVQHLAVKVLRDGRVEPQELRRFKNEQQILATLEHPHIARLLDAGTTDDGHPYIAMEYVDGQRIDQYCDTHRMNTVQRVKLFQKVCEAVQFAHQRLVIHRDLKPANILISQDGNPKLLDFGIAKLLDPELYFQTAELTATAVRPMTPDYASPEQARGEAVTTASDVYALGVILYRLLTGHPPYQVGKLPPAKMVETICEQEPEKPSVIIHRTEVAATHDGSDCTLTPESVSLPREGYLALLRRKLSGDLDNIVLKALHKEPARRYGSAEQLADDLGRYLDGMPVHARPDTLWYRTSKYVKRNSLLVGATALLFVSMAAGILATARQARIARNAQARAEKRFGEVQRFAHEMIFDVHDSIQNLPGATSARRQIVQDALFYLDNLAKESNSDPSLLRELAAGYQKIGDVQGLDVRSNMGETAAALESYRKAVEILSALVNSNPGDASIRRELAAAYNNYGSIQLQVGNVQKSLEASQKCLQIIQELAQNASPTDRQVQLDLALSYNRLSDSQVVSGDFDGGADSARQSLAMFEKLSAADPSNRRYRRGIALEHKKVGGIYEYTGKLDKALAEDEKALPINEALVAEDPNDTLARRDLAITFSSVGDVLLKKGQVARALKLFQQAAAIDDALAAVDPKDAWGMKYQVYDGKRIGDCLLVNGDVAGAGAAYQKAVRIAERRANLDASNTEAKANLADIYAKLGGAWYRAGLDQYSPAAKQRSHLLLARFYLQKSLGIWEQLRTKGAIQASDSDAPREVSEALLKCQQSLKKLKLS
jgi:eukaryotic-like serine/threonine-protein kinase